MPVLGKFSNSSFRTSVDVSNRYCFGAPYVMNSLTPSGGLPPVCDVGAFAHPAFLKESHFQNIERPLFLSCAETDFTFETDARNKAISILREAEKPYCLQLFSGVEHGFALRCDLNNAYERWCKEESAAGITRYFDLQLGVFDEKSKSGSKL
jgi:dienelactone hydrolase